jgi:hypothetical protein
MIYLKALCVNLHGVKERKYEKMRNTGIPIEIWNRFPTIVNIEHCRDSNLLGVFRLVFHFYIIWQFNMQRTYKRLGITGLMYMVSIL